MSNNNENQQPQTQPSSQQPSSQGQETPVRMVEGISQSRTFPPDRDFDYTYKKSENPPQKKGK